MAALLHHHSSTHKCSRPVHRTGWLPKRTSRPCMFAVPMQEVAQILPDTASLADVHTAAAMLPVLADAAPPVAYTPGPVEVGWQIWFAAVVSTIPFVIGAYEFGKRILIQRRCKVCSGSGLVQRGKYQRKCPECGGFFPWISWRMFLSGNARPGNGGPLLQPRGQTSVFYTVPPADGEQQPTQQQQQEGQGSGPSAATSTAPSPTENSQ